MTPYGATGPRDLTLAEQRLVADWILFELMDSEPVPSELWSGCADGTDTLAVAAAQRAGVPLIGLTLPRIRPQRPHGMGASSWPRILPCNHNLYARASLPRSPSATTQWVVEAAEPGLTAHDGYRNRDALTVSKIKVLLATPRTHQEEIWGSGTWMTVRLARKAGIEIRFCPVNGDDPWVEPAREGLF